MGEEDMREGSWMKDLAIFLGPFAHLHTFWPESIISAASIGGTCVDAVLFNNWDLLVVTGGFLSSLTGA